MILADGRWQGPHGIGRFAKEILSRLTHCEIFTKGPKPLSIKNLLWQPYFLSQHKKKYRALFSPGFNPILFSTLPYVMTIHDLIHLSFPGNAAFAKKLYYDLLIKPSVQKAFHIVTVSEYSKQRIIEWAGIKAEKITVAGNGVSSHFHPEGKRHQPGYPYLLHTSNTKAHKNTARMLEAFAIAKIDPEIKFILTGEKTKALATVIQRYSLEKRIIFSGTLTDETLAEYYRGAHAFLFPSLYEGFGLPVIEAMTSGIPVLTSNVTSLPEVAGDAALLVDPYQIDAIINGIEKIVTDEPFRKTLIIKGLEQTRLFTWDKAAEKIQNILG